MYLLQKIFKKLSAEVFQSFFQVFSECSVLQQNGSNIQVILSWSPGQSSHLNVLAQCKESFTNVNYIQYSMINKEDDIGHHQKQQDLR